MIWLRVTASIAVLLAAAAAAGTPARSERGEAASRRARTLLDGRVVTFERVGRSYNRTVARVRLNGRDLGETLVAMGAARPWLRHQPKPDWCS
jgi:endonuclease YncB( thermonuclease family)